MGGGVVMQRVARRAAGDGASEFGDAYLDVFQAPGGGFFSGFYPVILETEILGLRVIADLAAILAVGAYIPSACP